jgi:hypothetical protein
MIIGWCALAVATATAGAPDTRVDQDEAFIGARRNYWAFRVPVRPEVPAPASQWVRTPVDAFILEALMRKGLAPSSAAPRERLLRRLYLDVIGLPPSLEDMRSFLADRSTSAWERAVDRLMPKPQYGERLALKWLDVVRYADTDGFEVDELRPDAWRYRDYVVCSFNADKPYDRFIREQIAGDELFPGNAEALLALGFLRAGPRHQVGGNQDDEKNRQEDLVEMTGAVASTFMGLTVGCARCHNHKFDPILQSDYYRLQAIFAATDFREIDIATEKEKGEYEASKKAYQVRLQPIRDEIAQIEQPYRERLQNDKIAHLDTAHAGAFRLKYLSGRRKANLTPEQERLVDEAEEQVSLMWDEVVRALSPEDRDRRAALRRRLHELELEQPAEPARALAVAGNKEPPATYILKVGDSHHKLARVEPGFPKVLEGAIGVAAPVTASGRRAALAEFLASPQNPLTARVMVNRIWQFRMGTGLVATPNDFGLLGGKPGNPKLLDWLAVEFMEHGWSIKHIDRLILLSSVYRQATDDSAAQSAIDPDNRLYWRMARRRLDAETMRDSVLAVSGLLNAAIGGPPVRVPLEPEVYALVITNGEPDNLWPLSPVKTQQYRRSLYLLNKRTVRLPLLANFDQPDDMTSCPVRPVSTHALQALSLMNSEFMHEQSQAFAARLQTACGQDRTCAVKLAYELALARPSRKPELEMARNFLRQDAELADFCLALLNRNEFVYVP